MDKETPVQMSLLKPRKFDKPFIAKDKTGDRWMFNVSPSDLAGINHAGDKINSECTIKSESNNLKKLVEEV